MVKVIVSGAAGRMGSLIIRAIQDAEGIELVGALENPGHQALGEDVGVMAGVGPLRIKVLAHLEKMINQAEVLIDFTTPEATKKAVQIACKNKKSMVIGTTALPEDVLQEIRELSKIVPVVQAPNMSVGVNLLFDLLPQMATVLGKNYDIEVIEAHHRFKKDAPSGTAMKMAQILAKTRNLNLEQAARYGREGLPGERTSGEIGLHAIRAGDIVGEHTVVFGGLGERIEITHKAHNRQTFAQGAVRAALFVVQQPAGLYDMQDVLKGE